MEAKSKQPGSLRTTVPVSISIEPGLLPVILGPAEGSVPGWIPGTTYFQIKCLKVIIVYITVCRYFIILVF